jgi:hypothetical protein
LPVKKSGVPISRNCPILHVYKEDIHITITFLEMSLVRIDGSIAKKVYQWYICTWETESGKYIWKSLSYHNIYHFRVCFDIVPMAQRIRISWDQHNFHTSSR